MHTKMTILAGCAIALFQSAPAIAQQAARDYPNKSVRWIVTFPPGGSNDLLARIIGQKLSESLGQQFIIDNRAGAGGMLGAEAAARANPDGYTLLLANAGPSLNNVLMRKKPTYQVSDFAQVVWFGYAPLIIVANASSPIRNAKELVSYAKANPGKLTWGSSGAGGTLHIGLAQFQAATGINVTHVPYKGSAPALIALVSGQINMMHTTTLSIEAHLKAGRLKVLAIAGPKRQSVIPDIATLMEQGIKDGNSIAWYGLSVPTKTPRAIIDKLNHEVNKALETPDIRRRLEGLGLEVEGGSPEKFEALIKSEHKILAQLIKSGAVELE